MVRLILPWYINDLGSFMRLGYRKLAIIAIRARLYSIGS